jgi:hypothetical protein
MKRLAELRADIRDTEQAGEDGPARCAGIGGGLPSGSVSARASELGGAETPGALSADWSVSPHRVTCAAPRAHERAATRLPLPRSIVFTGFLPRAALRTLGSEFPRRRRAVHAALFLANDANDLIGMARTCMAGDISASARFDGDFEAALRAISCRAIVVPSDTDLYFRVADNAYEVAYMPQTELRPIPPK